MAAQDQWSTWLLETRFGGDAASMSRGMAQLYAVRDQILKDANIRDGDTLLDVGCGDGLVAFGALDRVGDAGRVIFSDISVPLLEHCRELAAAEGAENRCTFIQASAEDLTVIRDATVDVVTTRSVLIYVRDKQRSFRELHRVLRPGGRVSLFEPINRFNATYTLEDDWWAAKGTPVETLAIRLRDHFQNLQPLDTDPMLDFDAHDLLRACEGAGFHHCHLTYHVLITPSPPGNWDAMINTPGNPNIPSISAAMDDIFSTEERALFEAHTRRVVQRGGRVSRLAVAYLTARKDG